jgi:hypothetical protein
MKKSAEMKEISVQFTKISSFHLPVNFIWTIFHTTLFYEYELDFT